MCDDEVKKGSKPLKIKKMYVLAALLVEKHQDQSKLMSRSTVKRGGNEVSKEEEGSKIVFCQ